MKMNYALILAATLSSGLVVQQVSADNQLPPLAPAPAPTAAPDKLEATPAPAPLTDTAPKKKAAPAKKAAAPAKKALTAAEPEKPAMPLTPGPALARQPNVNVRGQAAINSEIVTHLKRGDRVTVLEEVTLKKPKLDEPAKWAKIALPANAAVWVHTGFIDAATKAVIPKRLNLRSGPGENYSVIGRLEKGAPVKEIETKGEWIKIEPPAAAYGFVAAHLLVNESAVPAAPAPPAIAATEPPKAPITPALPPVAPETPPATPPETVVMTTPPTPAPATEPTTPPTTPAPPAITFTTPPAIPSVTPPPAEAVTTPPPAPVTEPKEEELVKRVISREGIVKRSVSIQAPSYFVLESLDTGKTINYLFSSTTNVPLKDFRGQRIVVTGEEQLDERWPNTPVIYVESLQAVP